MPYCPNCGKDHPYGQPACKNCGQVLNTYQQPAYASATNAATVPPAYAAAAYTGYTPAMAAGQTQPWVTSFAAGALGAVGALGITMALCAGAAATDAENQTVLLVALGIYLLAGIAYASLFYPTLFTTKRHLQGTHSALISFANVLLAGFFGLLMNRNLTKGRRGCAHIIFVIYTGMGALSLISSIPVMF